MPTAPVIDTRQPTLMVSPWHDPVAEAHGHDVRSHYVEMFWLNILGPTALWSLRRLVDGLTHYPLGYELDLAETAGALGLSYSNGAHNSFGKALHRCVMFGVARPDGDGLSVRRRIPPVATRHLARMPLGLQVAHREYVAAVPAPSDERARANRLAEALVLTGDDPDMVERHLLAVGISPLLAEETSGALRY